MQFKTLSVLAVALSAQVAYAATADQQAQQSQQGQQAAQILTAKDIINTLSKISGLFADTAQTVTHTSLGNLASTIPTVVHDLVEVGEEVARDAIQFFAPNVDGTFDTSDQKDVCDAFHKFTDSNKNFIDAFIGQDGAFGNSIFRLPVAAVLKTIEGVVENLAKGLLGVVPDCQKQAQKDFDSINNYVSETVSN